MARRYLDFMGLADYISLSVQTLYNWKCTDPGKLPPHVCIPTGGQKELWRFDTEDVDKWMRGEQEEAKA